MSLVLIIDFKDISDICIIIIILIISGKEFLTEKSRR